MRVCQLFNNQKINIFCAFDPAAAKARIPFYGMRVFYLFCLRFPVAVIQDPQSFEQQVCIVNDVTAAILHDSPRQAAGRNDRAGIAYLFLHPVDHAVKHRRMAV